MNKVKLTISLIFIVNTCTLAQWLQSGGPIGGYTNQIVNIGSSLYVSASNGGVYKSTNNGETWIQKNYGLPLNEGVLDLVENNGILYASMSQNGLYKSTNEGESWIPINSGIGHLTFYNIWVENSCIFAGNANGGVYYSPDNGNTWLEKSAGISDIHFRDFAAFNSTIYAGGRKLFKSSNNGDIWEEVAVIGMDPNGIRSMVSTETTLYLGDDGNVFTSSDGFTWTKSTLYTGGTIVSMGVSADSVFLTTRSGKFYYTKDNGLNWTLIQNNETTSFASNVILLNDKMIMSTSEGLYSSVDGGISWFESNEGINALQVTALAINNSNLFAGTERQGIYRSDLSGNWTKINSGLDALNSTSVHDIFIIKDQLIIGTGGGIYSSIDNGDNWERLFNPGASKSIQALDFDNGKFACGVNGLGVYVSTDTAKIWSLTGTTGLNIATSYQSIMVKGDTIAVSTANSEIFVSENFGSTWQDISIPGNYYYTYDIQFANGKLYAGTSKGLLVSEDLGENWTFFNNEVKSIKSFTVIDGKVYSATSNGVYVTSASRDVWYEANEGLGNMNINEILISDDKIYAGTFATSVWERFTIEANIPPQIIAASRALVITEDTPFILQLSDLIVDGDNKYPEDFTLTILDGNNYTFENNKIIPNQDYNGTLIVNIIVNDGMDDSPMFGLSIEVTPVNDAPVIISQLNSLTTTPGTGIVIKLEDLLVEDVDNNYPLDFSLIILEGNNYTVSDNVITPSAGFIGILYVPVMVNDGGLDSEEFLLLIEVTEILGIEDIYIKNNFTVYPNPFKNLLRINSVKLYNSFQINIFTSNGKLVYSKEIVDGNIQSFNLSSIPNGVYILQIIAENQVGAIKLIKE